MPFRELLTLTAAELPAQHLNSNLNILISNNARNTLERRKYVNQFVRRTLHECKRMTVTTLHFHFETQPPLFWLDMYDWDFTTISTDLGSL